MKPVSVVGNSGSGKSTLARELAAILGVPHLELDGVNHQPGWEPLPREEFRRVVSAKAAEDGWVIDGNYSSSSRSSGHVRIPSSGWTCRRGP